MGAATFQIVPDRREALGPTLLLSLALHGTLFVFAFVYSARGGSFGGKWGRGGDLGSATRVNTITSLPGVPLPAPLLTTPSTLATENPGLYREEPKPQPPPPEKAVEIPKFKEAVMPQKPLRVNRRIQKQELEAPENAIPFGVGGRPSMTYSQFVNTAGGGGLSFGEGDFAQRYSWYVAAVRNRISSNWLLTMISPSIMSAPRVYITFDILRDGTVDHINITQSAQIPEIDRSALRAVLASSPFGPLPPDYAGDTVSVEFYFDFHR